MKKNLLRNLCFALILCAVCGNLLAQDFIVSIPITDKCGGLIVPLKSGGTYQLQISVKNNIRDTCTVSIVKSAMGVVEPWVSIGNNSQTIFPAQQINFLLTINVPASALDMDYTMFLNFNAFDKKGNNHSFTYTSQVIIVDNSIPLTPTFSVSQTSNTIEVYSWSSFDTRSNEYTTYNTSSGFNGIKSYTAVLKNTNGTVVGTKPNDATGASHCTFTGLAPNTNYKASVIATDMAGNSNSSEITTITAPAPPSISAQGISYCSITLAWTASSGATNYQLYNVTSTPVLVTTIDNTSFVVSGLTSGTTYRFYVKAYNSSGLVSDAGNTLSVTTLTVPVPEISGPSSVCSSGASFAVTNLPSECNLAWDKGTSLSLYSANGNSATYRATGNGTSWIKATINSGCGVATATKTVDVGSSKPGTITIQFDAPPKRFTASIDGMISANSYKWYLDGVLKYNTTETSVIFQRQLSKCGHVYYVDVAMVNGCGTSPISHTEVSEPPCYKSYTVYPNPTTSEINITQNPEMKKLSLSSENPEPKMIRSVKIIDNNGLVYVNKRYSKETSEIDINVSNLKTGTYQIIINEGEGQESHLFFKN